jgi:hypothetical protein
MSQMDERFLTVAFEPFSSTGEQTLDDDAVEYKNGFSIRVL